MREILFRGKSVTDCRWVFGDLSNYGDYRAITTTRGFSIIDSCEVIPETVGQYTGVKDKNGTKIFEGDIIRHHYKNLAKNGYTSDKGVVKWDCKECFFYRTSLSGEDKTISVDCIYEVIGNIYDNPELLEGDKT